MIDRLVDFDPNSDEGQETGAREKAASHGYRHLQAQILKLDPREQQLLFQALKSQLFPRKDEGLSRLKEVRERRFGQGLLCPHCQAKAVRYGTYEGKQRYRCKSCRRTFGDFTFSPLYRTRHPELWPAFIEHFFLGYSLRKSAKILGISHVILFYWRHKVLAALRQLAPESLAGILEVDETFLLYSQKGQRKLARKARRRGGSAKKRGISNEQACILVARDRQRHTRTCVAGRGQLSREKAKELLGPALAEVTTLCSDETAAFKALAQDRALKHVVLTGTRRERIKGGIYHIQNVNALHCRFKQWLGRFNGVATKYLDHYLAWFHFAETHRLEALTGKSLELLVAASLTPLQATCKDLRLAPCPFAFKDEDPRLFDY